MVINALLLVEHIFNGAVKNVERLQYYCNIAAVTAVVMLLQRTAAQRLIAGAGVLTNRHTDIQTYTQQYYTQLTYIGDWIIRLLLTAKSSDLLSM